MIYLRIDFDLAAIAAAFDITPEDVVELFTDGRPASFLMKRKIAKVMGWKVGDKNADYDWQDSYGNYIECRVLTSNGVAFAPNKLIGTQRQFDESQFIAKLNFIKFYLVPDIQNFPFIQVWRVDSSQIREWYFCGQMTDGSKLSPETFKFLVRQGNLFSEGEKRMS